MYMGFSRASIDAARALICSSLRSLGGRIQNWSARMASPTRPATSSTGVYTSCTPASAIAFSNDSIVVGGFDGGFGFAYSAGRLRHDENSPVRSTLGPGKSTDADTVASIERSCAYSDSVSVTTEDLLSA